MSIEVARLGPPVSGERRWRTPAAAEYPERPITFINPNSAGGGTDVGVRTWAPYVEKCLGNGATFVVTAMPGATGAIGMTEAAKARQRRLHHRLAQHAAIRHQPDRQADDLHGRHVRLSSATSSASARCWRSAPTASSRRSTISSISPRQATQPINVGIGGLGADDHLGGLRFEQMIGVDFNFIPFGDGASFAQRAARPARSRSPSCRTAKRRSSATRSGRSRSPPTQPRTRSIPIRRPSRKPVYDLVSRLRPHHRHAQGRTGGGADQARRTCIAQGGRRSGLPGRCQEARPVAEHHGCQQPRKPSCASQDKIFRDLVEDQSLDRQLDGSRKRFSFRYPDGQRDRFRRARRQSSRRTQRYERHPRQRRFHLQGRRALGEIAARHGHGRCRRGRRRPARPGLSVQPRPQPDDRRRRATAQFLDTWGQGVFSNPHGLHIGPDDSIFCTDDGDHTVRKCTLDGKILLTLGVPDKPSPYMSRRAVQPLHAHGRLAGKRLLRLRRLRQCPHPQIFAARASRSCPGARPASMPASSISRTTSAATSMAGSMSPTAKTTASRSSTATANTRRRSTICIARARCMLGAGKCPICYVGEIGPYMNVNRKNPNLGPRVSITTQ